MISITTNRDGSFTVGCASSAATVALIAGSSYAQCVTAYQSIASFSECQSDLYNNLDSLLDGNFDLKVFIRAGTATNVTGAGVGTFLAIICNNYRTLRASIAAATNLTQLNTININSGWPANP